MNYEQYGIDLIEKYRKQIIKICNRPTHVWFDMYRENVQDAKDGLKRIFIDNDSDILFVGHLDTVHDKDGGIGGFHWNNARTKSGHAAIMMPTCDDRLGVATALTILPDLGLNFDILLTEGEESGKSTAEGFKTDKEYKWMFELDRAGSSWPDTYDDDAVLYNYGSKEWRAALKDSGFGKIGRGSFTDICKLYHLGCQAINVAIGYYANHTRKAYFVIGQWARSIKLVENLYNKYKDTSFKYEKKTPQYDSSYYYSNRYSYNAYEEGMVVTTKATGRHDNKQCMGILSEGKRRNIWLLVDNDRIIVDTPERWDIIDQVICNNCYMEIRWEFHNVGNGTFCGDCHQVIGDLPENLYDAFLFNHGYIRVDGELWLMESCSKEGVLINKSGYDNPDFVPYSELIDATAPDNNFVIGDEQFIIKEVDGDKVYIHTPNSDLLWGVPYSILNKGENNVTE